MAGKSTDSGAMGSLDTRVRRVLAARLGIDRRALAALRVALGGLLLADLLLRSRHLVAFHADAGVLPHDVLRVQYPAFSELSVHLLFGSAVAQAALFVLAGAFALALLAGYRTRLATLGSLCLLVSLHAANPLVLNAGDRLLRRLLFWGLFLPLGGRWSVDAVRRDADRARSRERVASLASFGLLVQVVAVYATNAVFKLRGGVWTGGDALRYALELDSYATPIGDVLVGLPALLSALGWAWLGLVVLSPVLLVLTGTARALFVGAFLAGHLAMALTMSLGLFPFVSMAALVPFLPPRVWDALERRVGEPLAGSSPTRWVRERVSGSHVGVRGSNDRLARWGRGAGTALLATGLVVLLVWNAAALGFVDVSDGDSDADLSERRWDMFANPPTAERWYVAEGRLESGERVEAFRLPPGGDYTNARWRKYAGSLPWEHPSVRQHVASYACERWDAGHKSRVETVTLSAVERTTHLDGPDATAQRDLGTYRCRPSSQAPPQLPAT